MAGVLVPHLVLHGISQQRVSAMDSRDRAPAQMRSIGTEQQSALLCHCMRNIMTKAHGAVSSLYLYDALYTWLCGRWLISILGAKHTWSKTSYLLV